MSAAHTFGTALRAGVFRAPIATCSKTTRGYAAAASASATAASNKPPVALFGVDGTYASALYIAAAKSNALDPTAKSLESLSSFVKKDGKLSEILRAPNLSTSDKQKVMRELQKQVSADKDGIINNLLKTLAENNRLSVLESIVEKYSVLMSAHRGEVELVVTSATPLDNRTLNRLESAITKSPYVQNGQSVKLVPKVNPEIRGGLIVEIGDRTIDLSVSAKMAKMNKLLTDTL